MKKVASLGSDLSTAEWNSETVAEEDELLFLFIEDGSRITVLDRMTGFGFRDVETGFKDEHGAFWLASGKKDVRKSGCKTVKDAIAWIKENANQCVEYCARKDQS